MLTCWLLCQFAALWPAAPQKSYSGQLKPGQWAYVNLLRSQLTDPGDVSIKFSSSSGHSILMAQQSGYPTLTNFYVKFSDENLNATSSNTYHINRTSLENGNVILGVFNVDYQHRGISDFEIVILGENFLLEVAKMCSYFLYSVNHLPINIIRFSICMILTYMLAFCLVEIPTIL